MWASIREVGSQRWSGSAVDPWERLSGDKVSGLSSTGNY
jgi:hypothetical protein